MQIIIRPMDVWFFRDGKPFTAGEDHVAESVFPPSPFTLQGAVRTKVLVDKGINPSEFAQRIQSDPDVGHGNNFGKLRLRGPLVMHRKADGWERLIPMPADVVNVEGRLELLRPNELPFTTNLPYGLKLLWAQTGERVAEAKDWLPESEWVHYLQGQPPRQVVSSEELFAFEPRVGIAIELGKGTAQEAMLYQVRFVRPKDGVVLWAEVDGVPMSEDGFLRLGGEGRASAYEVLQRPLPSFTHVAHHAKRFKVVLLTPAWFSEGWQPKDGNWLRIFCTPLRLVGAAIPRIQRLGGFDVAKGIPKPMRPFVPAGAVYFFEADEPLSLADAFAFTETPDEVRQQNGGANAWAQIGLGVALLGVW